MPFVKNSFFLLSVQEPREERRDARHDDPHDKLLPGRLAAGDPGAVLVRRRLPGASHPEIIMRESQVRAISENFKFG